MTQEPSCRSPYQAGSRPGISALVADRLLKASAALLTVIRRVHTGQSETGLPQRSDNFHEVFGAVVSPRILQAHHIPR